MLRKLALILLLTSPLGAAIAEDFGSRLSNLFSAEPLIPGQQEFLDPDVAFVLGAAQADAQALSVHWQVADGYYLYRDKFKFSVAPDTVVLGEPRFPAGEFEEDPEFGRVEVHYGDGEALIPVSAAPVGDINITVGYQGCAKDGICYPPMQKSFTVAWSGTGTPAVTPAAVTPPAEPPVSEQDRVASLLGSESVWAVGLSFFGFGLLLAFTPCVLPMLPILSGILVGRGQRLNTVQAFLISLTYVVAMALVYAAAGVVAGLFGHNLQAIFQDPWVLGAFSAVFVLLALSMFGFYELQLPASWQSRISAVSSRQQGGSLRGSAVMGALSALIVGPCVAPPLAGALIFIGQSGDALRGGLALACLGLGMGTPLIILGTSTGNLLPRAGAWMRYVQAVFGVVLLGVAIWLLSRILPDSLTLVLWALLLIVSGIYLGAFDAIIPPVSGWRRLWKGMGIALVVYGATLVVGAAGGGSDLTRPLAPFSVGAVDLARAQHTALPFETIDGRSALEAALNRAKGQPVMLDFYADWCVECKEMERHTFADDDVRMALSEFVLLQADVTDYNERDRELLSTLGLYGPPAILFFDRDARELAPYRLVGFVGPEDFRSHLERIQRL